MNLNKAKPKTASIKDRERVGGGVEVPSTYEVLSRMKRFISLSVYTVRNYVDTVKPVSTHLV